MESIILKLLSPTNWDAFIDSIEVTNAMQALERGRVLLFGTLGFSMSSDEQRFLSPECADPRSKNVSYDFGKDEIRGTSLQDGARQDLTAMMRRFATRARRGALSTRVRMTWLPGSRTSRMTGGFPRLE